ncbi:UDP-glucose 4-epimerase GalE [Candidatus Pelagibacter sp. RS40]|uniref:UDP-glucose 4-epimerase GalE n=1 Tax=Candidatus Pelagibacter sp. RS40 TaxID=1977865 RepID=UPI000A1488BC|nr:UDP-glucose 4-epimerase GalE [Candidatus Pelagibacter sp. RS40]ARJ49537.1 UDP-glucose 4-epimerase GalE [Candidatus Pelagibacter sp. RS40]
MYKSSNNILVTGGAGYIGSHIVEKLVKTKNRVIILDNLVTGYKKLINKKAKFIKADIKNKKDLTRIIKNNKIESIIHLAAYLNVSEAEKNKKKYYNNNVIGTKNLIEACGNSSVKNIIFSSSCAVYGNVKGAVDENKKPNPGGYYGYTKFKGEELIKKYKKKYNYNFGILRYFNVAGASLSGKIGEIETSHGHLIKNLAIESLKNKPKINIFGNDYLTKDGTCIRDYIHVSDLADIHIKGLKYLKDNQKSFILNCGYGKGYSVQQIVNIFKKIKKGIEVKYQKRRPGDIAQVFANTSKFKKIIIWRPKYNDIKLIIQSAIKWEKKLKTNFYLNF